MIFVNSATEPGQPCVMTSGIGLGPVPRAWMKWMPEVADAGLELRERVQRRLGGPPVVALVPMGDELAQVREVASRRSSPNPRSRRESASGRGARADR